MTTATQTAPKTIEEILEAERREREEWEARTTHRGYTIADLRKAMDAVQSKDHWKDAWRAAVPHQMVGAVIAAVEFFHADRASLDGIEAVTGRVLMSGNGYQAW